MYVVVGWRFQVLVTNFAEKRAHLQKDRLVTVGFGAPQFVVHMGPDAEGNQIYPMPTQTTRSGIGNICIWNFGSHAGDWKSGRKIYEAEGTMASKTVETLNSVLYKHKRELTREMVRRKEDQTNEDEKLQID